MKIHPDSIACDCCGKEIPPESIEPRYHLPDMVFERLKEGTTVGDIITKEAIDFKDHCYIRGLMAVPVCGRADPMQIGIWVEVDQDDLYAYISSMESFRRQQFKGRLANVIPNYPELREVEVVLLDHSTTTRPSVTIKEEDSPLGQLQRVGIKEHDVIDFFGNKK